MVGKATLLCDNGAATDLRGAIFAYNHSTSYVDQVLARAAGYSQTTLNTSATCASFQSSVQRPVQGFSTRALAAVRFACGQLGKPYVWGGTGSPGFDCSGLTVAAYAAAGIAIPRTAQSQYQAGPLLRGGTTIQPGDLIFFGVPGNVHHVAISLGGTAIVHAPDFGQPVQVADYRVFKDVLAVSRPTN